MAANDADIVKGKANNTQTHNRFMKKLAEQNTGARQEPIIPPATDSPLSPL